eukprot:scaffold5453_cov58-Attheya_sp.AAC.3
MKLLNLPLRPSTIAIFARRGFITTEDVLASKTSGGIANLAAELGCTMSEAANLTAEVDSARKSTGSSNDNNGENASHVTAASLLLSVQRNNATAGGKRNIVTFCKAIDMLLGGGFARAEVTEVAGVPGVGKTQISMQLCVDARLPKEYGGIEGEAVYIDSEGSFSPERCFKMAQALVDHVHKSTAKRQSEASLGASDRTPSTSPDWFTANNILEGIHVFRVHDESAQTATIRYLSDFLRHRQNLGKPIKVVIIDSIAFHYRSAAPNTDYKARTRSLAVIASLLSEIASTLDVAVVVINQMTTKVGGRQMDDTRLVPALGESWAHATTTRLILSQSPTNPDSRTCTLVKSPHKPIGTAAYAVTEYGIRDVVVSERNALETSYSSSDQNRATLDSSKRARSRY